MRLIATAFLTMTHSVFSFSPTTRTALPRALLRPPRPCCLRLYGDSTGTGTEKDDDVSFESLESALETKCANPKVRQVIKDMLNACAEITETLRSALATAEGNQNDCSSGDGDQLSVDVIADNLIWDAVRASSVVREGASEADPVVRNVMDDEKAGEGEFTVCWDPLDGSSIVHNDYAVETLMGIWPKSTGGLIGSTGADQVTSLVALYGPLTTVLVALDDGTYEFRYGCTPKGCQLPDGSWEPWVCSRQKIQISSDCKIFSSASLRAAHALPGYRKLVDHIVQNRYTLRQDSDGLVPDVFQAFTKKRGRLLFSNPSSKGNPAKLRLAFEAAPFGLLVEKAGGRTSDGVTGGSILDVEINAVNQRTALFVGSSANPKRWSTV